MELKKLIKKRYEAIGNEYQQRYKSLFANRYNNEFDIFVKNLFIKDGYIVIDLGCGTGRFFGDVNLKNATYIGVDIASSLIKSGRNQIKDNKCIFVISDSEKLPFRNKIADVFIIAGMFEYITNLNKYLQEIFFVSRNNFQMVFNVWNNMSPFYFLLTKYEFDNYSRSAFNFFCLRKYIDSKFKINSIKGYFFFPMIILNKLPIFILNPIINLDKFISKNYFLKYFCTNLLIKLKKKESIE